MTSVVASTLQDGENELLKAGTVKLHAICRSVWMISTYAVARIGQRFFPISMDIDSVLLFWSAALFGKLRISGNVSL